MIKENALEIAVSTDPGVIRSHNEDAVFADPEASDGVRIDEVPTRHEAERSDSAGLIELWPAVRPPDVEEAEGWDAPRDRIDAEHPSMTLAQTIAKRIDGWLRAGEIVFDKEQKTLPV